ncbi:hypothetical protein GGR58DRAFT_490359 [Xylaria digitata]|nr:hypothetical protein GGR58DRAFT_490359 [Xylaria digitata]
MFGMSVLHRACSIDRVDYIKELRRRGSECNPKSKYRRSPIDIAVEHQNVRAVQYMIDWLETREGHGKIGRYLGNARVLAVQFEDVELENILSRAGAPEINRSQIKIRRIYLPEPRPEPGHLPLVLQA